MAEASINFKGAKVIKSEAHNQRTVEVSYAREDLKDKNESWVQCSMSFKRKEQEKYCKEVTGRKLQKNAVTIREAVININANHGMTDLVKVADKIKEKLDIECFQIHIHRDEGRWVDNQGIAIKYTDENGNGKQFTEPPENGSQWIPNLHAHMIFDYQEKDPDKKATKKIRSKVKEVQLGGKPKKWINFSEAQDIASEVLSMKRGQKRGISKKERLEAIEYKVQQEKKSRATLQSENKDLEQKKNKATQRKKSAIHTNTEARRKYETIHREYLEIEGIARKGIKPEQSGKYEYGTIARAIKLQQKWINKQLQQLKEVKRAIKDIQEQPEYIKQSGQYREITTRIKALRAETEQLEKEQHTNTSIRKEIAELEERINQKGERK